ncbi:hypothetical protein F5146DRAFT_1192503 [Armillaria mellea]|nr:hypothetical protein F5146DRAFT_1192503 [Armillaria mellea]
MPNHDSKDIGKLDVTEKLHARATSMVFVVSYDVILYITSRRHYIWQAKYCINPTIRPTPKFSKELMPLKRDATSNIHDLPPDLLFFQCLVLYSASLSSCLPNGTFLRRLLPTSPRTAFLVIDVLLETVISATLTALGDLVRMYSAMTRRDVRLPDILRGVAYHSYDPSTTVWGAMITVLRDRQI